MIMERALRGGFRSGRCLSRLVLEWLEWLEWLERRTCDVAARP
jgi:hypothetical protein